MARRALTLRWSWRDLRKRWVLVVTIALILAIGTATFASLGGTAAWRRQSNDESFAVTRLHDLRVRLETGNLATEGTLLAVARAMPDAAAVSGMEERLLWPVQLEVPTADGSALVRGHVVGAPLDGDVNLPWVAEGRALTTADDGSVLLERQFARDRELATSGTLQLSGGRPVGWVGHALQPEYFMGGASDEPGAGMMGYLSPGSYGVLFSSLRTAQSLAGASGQVNDLVLTLAEGTDVAAVRQQLEAAFASALPGVGVTVTTRDDVESYRVLYQDIEGDQQVWNIISVLVLLGASFAAFNLISRIVEAGRREIGVGMALGVSRRELAVRPLLVGIQVALLGVVAGIGVGLLLNAAMKAMFTSVLPLPVWRTPFQYGSYARAVAIGLTLPFLATLLPVWRAVRVEPVQAISTGRFATPRSGWASLARHLRWPRRSTGQYPLRNLLRNARRTVLTALAIAAAIVVLIGIVGMLDTFTSTVDRTDDALTYEGTDRLTVQLDGFVPAEGDVVTSVRTAPGIATVAPGLQLPGELRGAGDGEGFAVSLGVLPFATAPWSPPVSSGAEPSPSAGILLARKAADDLGVGPGDTVVLRHPVREGLSYRMVDSEVRVAGVHPIVMRSLVFLDTAQASLFGLDGITNTLQVTPAAGVTAEQVQRALFALPGVAAADPVVDLGETLRSMLDQYMGILRIMEGAVLLLALLIAFNSTSVAVDERSREHATMFAFGLPVRSVLRMTVVEAAVVGILGTVLGVVLGYGVLQYLFHTTLPETMPDVGFEVYLSPTTMVAAVVAGAAVVALAPLFTVRKLRRMDVPATLRVVE